MTRPLLAITMGDPAGVGPETIVSAWTQPLVHNLCMPLVIGNCEVMRRAVTLLDAEVNIVPIESPEDASPSRSSLPCLNAGSSNAAHVEPAIRDARGGQAAYDAVVLATELAKQERVDGLVTAPLNKAALHDAGHIFPGHTELLSDLCAVRETAMMLYLERPNQGGSGGLGIVHATLHMPLRDVFNHLNVNRIVTCGQLANRVMRKLAPQSSTALPRIGVCALNPHAGEEGIFGNEEQTIIAPAVTEARKAGLDITGPYPTDTLMARACEGEFDALVAMYHDQGHIALKLLGMHRAVNITLGLPVVRTSASHGTAFDRAWQGNADAGGMVEALSVAARLIASRQPLVVAHSSQ